MTNLVHEDGKPVSSLASLNFHFHLHFYPRIGFIIEPTIVFFITFLTSKGSLTFKGELHVLTCGVIRTSQES